jgi:glycosyltransferase involved in cell wall biosynthesis
VSGSGTSLKTVEFLAAGLPVVSTPVGVRGLDLPDDTVVIASGPQIVDAVASLAADDDRRSLLGAAGRSVAKARFSWDHIAGTAWDAIDRVLRDRPQ